MWEEGAGQDDSAPAPQRSGQYESNNRKFKHTSVQSLTMPLHFEGEHGFAKALASAIHVGLLQVYIPQEEVVVSNMQRGLPWLDLKC